MMGSRALVAMVGAMVWGLVAAPAAAHIGLESPGARYGSMQKDGPCGVAGGTRTDDVTVFEPGQTIEVVWRETIDHPGHFRVAFDPDGDDDLMDPACLSGCETRTPEIEQNTAGVMVLADGIEDRRATAGDSTYSVTVTLPDIECDNCTLQLIQVMYDKPPQTRPGNDIYYQCADLILQRGSGGVDGGGATGTDGGTTGSDGGPSTPGTDGGATVPPAGGGCGCRATGATSGAPLGWLALVGLFVLRRRR